MKKKQTTTTNQNTNQTTNQSTNQSSTGSSSGQYANRNFFGEYTPSDTADIQAFRGWRPQIDPGLSYQYGNARNKLQQSLNNPVGGYRTAAMDDAILRSGNRSLAQDESQAYRAGQYDVNQLRSSQLGSLASLTRPSLIQTGSEGSSSGTSTGTTSGTMTGTSTGNMTGTGTVAQPSNLFGDILGAGAQIGSAALMLLLLCFALSLIARSERDTMPDFSPLAGDCKAMISNRLGISSFGTFDSLVEMDGPFGNTYFSRRKGGRCETSI